MSDYCRQSLVVFPSCLSTLHQSSGRHAVAGLVCVITRRGFDKHHLGFLACTMDTMVLVVAAAAFRSVKVCRKGIRFDLITYSHPMRYMKNVSAEVCHLLES